MGWIEDYLDYNRRQESPEAFHYWSAVTTIAAVLNRKVWLPRVSDGIERYRIYPGQIMTLLVARSGRDRKSTAIRLPTKLLQAMGVKVLHGKTSPEKLLHLLGGHGAHNKKGILTILASELSMLYSRQQYAESILDVVTDLSDAPDKRDFPTISGGDITVHDACITFLGCTTPSSLAEAIPVRAHQHGFTSRHIVVYPDANGAPRRIEPLSETVIDPTRVQWAKNLELRLITGLTKFAKLVGPFDFSAPARLWYDSWYRKYTTNLTDESEGWPARRHDHLLRVAMVLQVAKNESLLLDGQTLMEADQRLQKVEETMDEAFAHIGVHANSQGVDRIVNIFKKHGGVCDSFTILEQAMRYFPDFQSLKRVINDMLNLKWLERVKYDASTGIEVYRFVRGLPPVPQPPPDTDGLRPKKQKLSAFDTVADSLDKKQ